MATIPTQNAVPSEAPRDLKFNSGKIDEFVTSLEHEYKDRFGRSHLTVEGMRWIFEQLMERFKVDINQAIIAAGYIPMDSFQQGAEITKRNEILRDETTGEYYRWDGDLPKSVPIGSTPESAGGVGIGAWVSVGDASVRGDLNNLKEDLNKGDGYKEKPSLERYRVNNDWLTSNRKIELIAHKGFAHENPENTSMSFSTAIDKPYATSIELDIVFTKDNVPCVFHDDMLDSLTNGTGNIHDKTLSEIKGLLLKSTENTPYSNLRIPTLDEVLSIISSGCSRVYLEFKGSPTATQQAVVYGVVNKYDMGDFVAFTCFDINVLRNARNAFPQAEVLLGVGQNQEIKESDINALSEILPASMLIQYWNFLSNTSIKKRLSDKNIGMVLWTIESNRRLNQVTIAGGQRIMANISLFKGF